MKRITLILAVLALAVTAGQAHAAYRSRVSQTHLGIISESDGSLRVHATFWLSGGPGNTSFHVSYHDDPFCATYPGYGGYTFYNYQPTHDYPWIVYWSFDRFGCFGRYDIAVRAKVNWHGWSTLHTASWYGQL